mmetsp:Transcript_34113/g.65170  ORF Transcript_34113/g.65170 Transcript_34113/m.65170 type:complete len:125 (-) Transcript_34113:516-890(-)|eukprot:CAMPEP_0114246398 /NCGR_PEP_ID=MMETSP0058-20121206/12439_1 /TAXON_ID=36894 /ORGANISM="Pyramimonas parkeae, CCMP726" /LENGTH=124 /DNA_ID=CAMNT_0001359577 /DNA_START=426 /DNA_END=800 /DNA_ORIENTATION=-
MASTSIRFRMQNGNDFGPKQFETSLTIQAIKDRLIAEWPKDTAPSPGDSAAPDNPKSAADLKLILAGQILDNSKTLSDLKIAGGSDEVVTMHLIVRMPNGPKSQGEGGSRELDKVASRCACVIA